MKFFNPLILLLILLTSCASSPQDKCGFLKNNFGERISWKGNVPVTLIFHESFPEEYKEAAEFAVQSWNKKAGKTILQLSTAVIRGPIIPAKDALNIIYYDTNFSGKKVEQAYANLKSIGDQIKDVDIVINAKDYTFYTSKNPIRNAINIETLLVHEMGHLLGLDHTRESSHIMYPYLPTNVDKSDLSSMSPETLKCEY